MLRFFSLRVILSYILRTYARMTSSIAYALCQVASKPFSVSGRASWPPTRLHTRILPLSSINSNNLKKKAKKEKRKRSHLHNHHTWLPPPPLFFFPIDLHYHQNTHKWPTISQPSKLLIHHRIQWIHTKTTAKPLCQPPLNSLPSTVIW